MATTKATEPKKPLGTYEKQKRVTIVFVALILVLAVCAGVAYYFVNLDKTSFEQGGKRYRVVEKDGAYVLTNEEGYTCEKTPDGYFVTDDGMLMVSVNEDGTYSVYAAVEGLEDGEEVYNRVAKTILIFPYVSQSNLQALEMHNEHGSYVFYRDSIGKFRVKGTEGTLATHDPLLFTALTTSTCNLIAQDKIIDPIVDENGEFSEYGLADSEVWWYVTTAEDKVYKAILGDKTPSGEGYYVQYVACDGAVLNEDGTVKSANETPRKAVYIVAPSVMNPTGTSLDYVEKPFHASVESLMAPQIIYETTLTNYFDVHNFVLMRGDDPFLAFDYIDIAERAHTEKALQPFVFLLKEHSGLNPSSDRILEALESFYGMTFKGVVKLNPSTEDLIEYGIYENPIHVFEEEKGNGFVQYYVRPTEDGTFALFDVDGNLCATDENGNYLTAGGAVLSIDAEAGTGETVSGKGIWDLNYSSPYSIYYNFDVTEDGESYDSEQLVHFSGESDHETFYAYSPLYGMIVEVAGYDLEFLHWDLFDWIESNIFHTNIVYMETIRIVLPDGTYHEFRLNNTESSQGKVTKLKESKYTDKNGTVYARKKVDGVYGLYKTTGPEHTVSVEAYFRLEDANADSTSVYAGYFGMPSGGRSEGWFKGKLYLTSDESILLCDAENGYFGVAELSAASTDLTVLHNNKDVVNVTLFRQYYQTLAYATIEQEHIFSPEEEAALLADPSALQLRVELKSTDRDTVFEFYYLTSRKSYIRISGDGGETFTGGMYVLSNRVNKLISDTDRLLAGETIDPTAKN